MSSAGGNSFGGRPGAPPTKSGGLQTPQGPEVDDPGIATIGSGITVNGSVECEVDLRIDGRVVGDVRCGTLLLSTNGLVTGNIFADRVRLSGRVEGGVEAKDVAIEAGAHIKGDVSYSRLRIANGGVFEGSMTHRPLQEEEAAAEGDRLKLVEPPPRAAAKTHYIE